MAVLAPGRHVILNFLPGTDGVPRLLEGMLSWFSVTGMVGHVPVPRVDGVFAAFDTGYYAPQVVSEHGLYEFRNLSASNDHELAFVRLAPGKTLADFKAWIAGGFTTPGPGTLAAGVTAVAPGTTTWDVVNLSPGNYVAADSVVDPATGLRFAAEGVLTAFTVK